MAASAQEKRLWFSMLMEGGVCFASLCVQLA